MTAAYELTRPEHGGKYQVTVYQEGWRLGGKGASGRGPAGRVEEHGLHVWFGFYDNAFRVMRETYGALQARPQGSPYGDWREAFLPEPDIGLFGRHEAGGWQRWNGRFPPRPGLPGDPVDPAAMLSLTSYMVQALDLAQSLLLDLEVSRPGAPGHDGPSPRLWPPDPDMLASPEGIVAAARLWLGRGAFAGAVALAQGCALFAVALQHLPALADTAVLRFAERLAAGVRGWVEDNLLADDHHRHVWEVVEVVLSMAIGMMRWGCFTDPRGLDIIDDYDCREWMRMNGASERAVNSTFIQGLYDLPLACESGDPGKQAIAAGNGLRGALRMFFGYRGAMFWRMRAGMGDVVFAPMYDLLRERGVDFRFFHRLTNIGLSPGAPDTPGHVETLRFDVQARVAGDFYQPMVEVAGRPCWPSQPNWTQLVDGGALAAAGTDFESHWDRTRDHELTLRVTEDFDFVVLGASVGAIPHIAPELVARDSRWRAMVDQVKTAPTLAFQVWLKEDLDALGWHGPPYIAAGFLKPFDTWCDMAHVVPEEGWTLRPATAVYFCGNLPDPPEPPADTDTGYPARRTAEVKAAALAHLADKARPLWPGAYDEGGFRWDLLVDHAGGDAQGPARFDSQYWRANVNPSDRYVLSLPGTLKYRISPLDPTWDNLTIAGDWTACGLNTGCTESAVMSGMLAAHALTGLPRLADIVGYDHP